MSATTPASDIARDPTDVYTLLIHESGEVCSGCHERIRAPQHAESDRCVKTGDLQAQTREQNTLGTGEDELDPLRRGAEGVMAYDCEDMDDYGVKRRHFARTYCGNCGQPGGRAHDDSPSKQQMLEAVPALVDRFAEAGIPINEDELQYLVGHLRTKEEYRGRETEIWQAATAVALQHTRIRDCVRATYPE